MRSGSRFAGKVVLVTGGGGTIGRGVVAGFAGEGAAIALHDASAEAGEAAVKEAQESGAEARLYAVDIAEPAAVRAAIDETIRDFGKIDVLVNVAAVNTYKDVFDFTDDDWAWIIGVNLTGTWNYCRYTGPHLVETGGSIVNFSSIGAMIASYYRAPYMASKGGVGMLTKALALDLAQKGVRVNAVAPGIVKTNMTRPNEKRLGVAVDSMIKAITPQHRWQTPESMANAAMFLASDEAEHITGTTIVVDGGQTAGNPVGLPWHPEPEEGAELDWLD